jgi:hypothetical protein
MMLRGKGMALSLLAVGTAAAAGYVLQTGRPPREHTRPKANLGARVVADVPDGATVIDASTHRVADIPGARTVLRRAIRADGSEQWAHVTLERDGAWSIVDAIRRSLPYYDADRGEYNGVYVQYDDRVVVLDAIGWAQLEEPIH